MSTPVAAPPPTLAPGTVFMDRYEVVRCIASGGMGAVYEVVHLETRRRRALKVMLPSIVLDPELRARFKLEATVAAEVHSEHIVDTFDAGVDPETGTPFLVMELLRGEELGAMLDRRGALSPEEVVELLFQAALALDRTHAAGIVHRDLKPENLFLTHRDDGTPHLKVLDFGIAKVVASSTSAAKSTQGMGTPLYMAPEQVHGDAPIGPATDLYSLGQIAYSLLTGEAWWTEDIERAGNVYPVLVKITSGVKEPASARAARRGNVTLPPAFDAWFAKATATAAGDRFRFATELVTELAGALGVAAPRTNVPMTAPSAAVSPLAPTLLDTGRSGAPAKTPPEPARSGDVAGAARASETITAVSRRDPPVARSRSGLVVAAVALGGALAGAGWLASRSATPAGGGLVEASASAPASPAVAPRVIEVVAAETTAPSASSPSASPPSSPAPSVVPAASATIAAPVAAPVPVPRVVPKHVNANVPKASPPGGKDPLDVR